MCIASNILDATVCEGSIHNISCPVGQVISVKFALYGRISRSKCVNFDAAKYLDKCMSNVQSTVNIVKSICEQKNSCSIGPDPNIYINECQGVNKYLQVKYVCA